MKIISVWNFNVLIKRNFEQDAKLLTVSELRAPIHIVYPFPSVRLFPYPSVWLFISMSFDLVCVYLGPLVWLCVHILRFGCVYPNPFVYMVV